MKKTIVTTATIGMMALAALVPFTASAQVLGAGNSIGNAFVLNSLFGGPFGMSGPFTSFGDLLLWNQLLNGGGLGFGGLGLF